tara:strand:+ start:1566 stop:2726 length:1161 start_codon:yes stop_codon:yes gene_type:complete
MKIAIYTYFMSKGTERLMPWRTLLETCNFVNSIDGFQATIITSSETDKLIKRRYQSIEIIEIPKSKSYFNTFFKDYEYDVIYYPISWRDGLKNLNHLSLLKAEKIAYVTGGVYSFRGVMSLLKATNISTAKPYIFELLTPKFLVTRKLKKVGFKKIITFSKLTAKYASKSGWKKNEIIISLPGKDNFHKLPSNKSILKEKNILNKNFFLFMGAPAEARGSIHLLEAFDALASEKSDALLVLLMRTDIHSNFLKFDMKLNSIKNADNILLIRDNLTPTELKTYVESARAVVLPFLIIPSEIPLTFFEVLSCGTPIITFKNGGTYDYIKDCVLACQPGDINSLRILMKKLFVDNLLYEKLSRSSLNLMKNHPDWSTTSKKWLLSKNYK